MMETEDKSINICQNCKNYWPHYIYWHGRFRKIYLGHCVKHIGRHRFARFNETCTDFERIDNE